MKYIFRAARYIAGATFIFSGLVKGVDPLGSMYKFIDYFNAFGLDSFNQFAFVLGIALSMAEFIIGFCIITGLRFRVAAWGLILFMGLFTPLTLLLALTNPVSDCGCFGDAVRMTNWQTFIKNIILLSFVIPLFIYRRKVSSSVNPYTEWGAVTVVSAMFIFFSFYNYRHLPVIDFRPYRVGVNIMEGMSYPEDAPADIYEIKLIYEKDGVRKTFSLEDYPSDDSAWVFVDQETLVLEKGYEPPIHDFILSSPQGDDHTWFVLENPGLSLIMISRSINEADQQQISLGLQAADICKENGIDFYLLTSSSEDEVLSLGANFNILFGDETMLKTLIRSNPGFLVLKGGTIMRKWSAADFPDPGHLVEEIIQGIDNPEYDSKSRLVILVSAALLFTLLVSYLLRRKIETINF